jgi:hypothetical protein
MASTHVQRSRILSFFALHVEWAVVSPNRTQATDVIG